MSLLITNHVLSNLLKTPINRDSPPFYGGDSNTSRSLKTLPESSSKAYKQCAALVFTVLNVARFTSIGTIALNSLVVTTMTYITLLSVRLLRSNNSVSPKSNPQEKGN